jgi:exonuclease-1
MGIQGLLPFLKSIQRPINVSSFSGQTAAVDAYCWLHKGAYTCAQQLVMKEGDIESL